jgi:hypothetical protein
VSPKRSGEASAGVKPLRVVDQAEKRLLVGHVGKKIQEREPDQKAIGPSARGQAERGTERITLRRRQPVETIQQRRTQLVETGERKLHLRLHSDGMQNPAAFRTLSGISK